MPPWHQSPLIRHCCAMPSFAQPQTADPSVGFADISLAGESPEGEGHIKVAATLFRCLLRLEKVAKCFSILTDEGDGRSGNK